MAKFLNTTTSILYQLDELIKGTKNKLILISPYLQFSDRIKENLENLLLTKPDIRIIYKENKLKPDMNRWLEEKIGIRVNLCHNLHAKCYINEKEAILASMNLYEFSQQNNNHEMGIYISKNEEAQLYQNIFDEANRLLSISQEIRITPINNKDTTILKKGYCIRTGVEIPFNPQKPFCKDSWIEWNKYKKEDYKEKYCHFSGELSNGETTSRHPILKKNWNKAIEYEKS